MLDQAAQHSIDSEFPWMIRVGPDPHANGAQTIALNGCPDLWELADGNFAVIGIDMTDAARPLLPPTAGCGPDERIVMVPRRTLIAARRDIPEQG